MQLLFAGVCFFFFFLGENMYDAFGALIAGIERRGHLAPHGMPCLIC